MAVISGAAWYSLSVGVIYRGPWLAVLMGLLIAVAVRLGCRPRRTRDADLTAGAPLYVLSVIVTHYFVARQDHMSLFRDTPSAAQVEDILTRDYLSSPMVILRLDHRSRRHGVVHLRTDQRQDLTSCDFRRAGS